MWVTRKCFVILQAETDAQKEVIFLRMEEQQRLPDVGSRCGASLVPNGCEGSNIVTYGPFCTTVAFMTSQNRTGTSR